MPSRTEVNPGDQYHDWTIIKEVSPLPSGRRVLCQCKCKATKVLYLATLTSDRSKRCRACALREAHAKGKRPKVVPQTPYEFAAGDRVGNLKVLEILDIARARCECTVCGDVRERYFSKLATRGGECKSCALEQKRLHTPLTLNGVTKDIHEWVKETGIPIEVVRDRLRRGWSADRSLTQPVQKKTRKR